MHCFLAFTDVPCVMQILIYSFVDTFFVVTSFLYHFSAMRGTTLEARLASLSSLLDEDKQGNSSTPTRCFKAAPRIGFALYLIIIILATVSSCNARPFVVI